MRKNKGSGFARHKICLRHNGGPLLFSPSYLKQLSFNDFCGAFVCIAYPFVSKKSAEKIAVQQCAAILFLSTELFCFEHGAQKYFFVSAFPLFSFLTNCDKIRKNGKEVPKW